MISKEFLLVFGGQQQQKQNHISTLDFMSEDAVSKKCMYQQQQWVKHNINNGESSTWRLMKLDVVSDDVLPSERLKRLFRLGNFLGSCDDRGADVRRRVRCQGATSV